VGYAIESVLGSNGNLTGSTTYDALTPGTGQSFTVRSYVDGTAAYLDDVWATDDDSAAKLSIKSPRMHDTTRGILYAWTNARSGTEQVFVPEHLTPGWARQRLYSTDILTVTCNTGASADIICALFNVRYENLGGVNARMARWSQIQNAYDNTVGVLTNPITAANGVWGAGVALTSIDNRLHADTDYAVLGWTNSVPCTAVALQGVDVGNLFVGGPGGPDAAETGMFFVNQSVYYGDAPYCPVINSNNAPSVFLQVADVVGSNTIQLTLIMAQLRNKFQMV
jgi:hypothetical protein